MYVPTLAQARDLARQGNLIPVYRELLADLETPVSVYLKIARGAYSFLLESVEGGERLARYSFIGAEPYMVVQLNEGTASIQRYDNTAGLAAGNGRHRRERRPFTDPLDCIRDLLRPYRPVPLPDLPRFQGGAVGYLSYEIARYFERLPSPAYDELGLPEAMLMCTDTLVVFDHVRHKMRVLSHADLTREGSGVEAAYAAAVARIDEIVGRIQRPALASAPAPFSSSGGEEVMRAAAGTAAAEGCTPRASESGRPGERPNVIRATLSQGEYEAAVERAIEYIRAGDIIQVVPSLRLSRPVTTDPFTVYRGLRSVNPSPYMYYLNLDDIQIVGASPEMLVQVEDGGVRTRPIAGTRPRGATEAEDQALAKELLADEKERAEHIMLVDLGRNDLGRVCRPGSVRVSTLMDIEKYSHVMHIVSQVEGVLRDDRTAYDALRSCFPAGTVSGAPKIRAMEIIAELEPSKRGTYAGAIGYFSYDGNLDTAIAIRTMAIKDRVAHVQAGGGVVADSIPAREYQEAMNKAAALLRAIEVAEEVERDESALGTGRQAPGVAVAESPRPMPHA